MKMASFLSLFHIQSIFNAVSISASILLLIFMIKFLIYAKKIGKEQIEESKKASSENFKHYPYFKGEFLEIVPVRETNIIKHPMMLRFKDLKTKEEVVRLTHEESFLNISQRHRYVEVYYSGSYIVTIFPIKNEHK